VGINSLYTRMTAILCVRCQNLVGLTNYVHNDRILECAVLLLAVMYNNARHSDVLD